MLLRVRAEAGASTGKFSIPEIPVLGLSYRKGAPVKGTGWNIPLLWFLPRARQGAKGRDTVEPSRGRTPSFLFFFLQEELAWQSPEKESSNILASPFLGRPFYKVPSGQGHNLILAGVGPGEWL